MHRHPVHPQVSGSGNQRFLLPSRFLPLPSTESLKGGEGCLTRSPSVDSTAVANEFNFLELLHVCHRKLDICNDEDVPPRRSMEGEWDYQPTCSCGSVAMSSVCVCVSASASTPDSVSVCLCICLVLRADKLEYIYGVDYTYIRNGAAAYQPHPSPASDTGRSGGGDDARGDTAVDARDAAAVGMCVGHYCAFCLSHFQIRVATYVSAPHPNVTVFPGEEDFFFWQLVIEGPDGTPYRNGAWVMAVSFPSEYPLSPPEMRFVTPILHCNVNSHGKICHSMYAPTPTTQCVYVLSSPSLKRDLPCCGNRFDSNCTPSHPPPPQFFCAVLAAVV